ncbi:MAG: hypothetical protein HKP13_07320, partial [Gammaproteobacteria bacterium]|nr:hypothetical protein [Gammaproteobacteria bacterium]
SEGTNVSTSKTFSQYGPVNARDTLWSIATRFRPNQSVSIEQVMLALQRYNPEAFSQNNINSLNAGAILRIPDLETITALSRTRALAEVDKQHVAWEDFRQKLAKSPVAAPEGSPVPDIKSKSDVADPKQSGRVEILSAGTAEEGVGHEGEENLKELRGQISLVKEELDAKSRENNDLRTRLAEAESLIQEFAHLMEIQSDEINALKTKLAQEKIESSIADPLTEFEQIQPGSIAQTPSMAPRTAPQEEGKILHEKGSGRLQLEPAKSIGLPSVSKIQAPVVEEQVMPKAEVPHAEPTGAGSAVGTLPSRINEWMDYIRDNLFVIAIVLGGIIVIFVVMASWLRARPTEEASDNGRTLDNSRVPNDGRAIDDSREFSDEPDTFLDSQPPATVHAVSPPDPGLSRAKSDRKHDSPTVERPDREPPPVRKKEPEKSEEIGEPVIFGGGDGEPVIPPAVDDPAQLIDNTPDNNIALDIGFGDDDDDDDVLSLEPDEANKNIGGRDLNAISNVAPEESDATMPPTPEWALDFAGPDLQEISPAETTDTQPITGENLDFNFGFDLDVEVSSESESPVGEGDNDQLFEFPPADTSGSIDEMQTKLDLAQAYIDMGDIEGARTILEKVLAEGEEKHKTLAKELLEKFD